MVTSENNNRFDQILHDLGELLDVSPSMYKTAKERYEAVGTWLDAEGSFIKIYKPEIYPQGSFALGTVIKPIGNEEYDVDVVCQLKISSLAVTQKQLKKMVGDRLKEHSKYREMLDSQDGGRRCWTLQYSEQTKFHMDILPAIPDDPAKLLAMGVNPEYANHAICITDKETWDTSSEWPKSNPKGYLLWFKEQMKITLLEGKRIVALKESRASLDDVQDYEVKTPLQRVIQLLKRHRDIQYPEDDDKPISIIITTLAAQSYNNEPTVREAFWAVVPKMRNELNRKKRGDEWWVPNPVNPQENFADKWAESPRKAQVFFEWIDLIEKQHRELLTDSGFEKIGEYLTEAYGAREAAKVLEKYDSKTSKALAIRGSNMPLVESVCELLSFNVKHRQEPRWKMNLSRYASIEAQVKKTGGWRNFTSNDYIMKGSKLLFRATTNVESPYEVYWQTVNTGKDARTSNDLRGEFNSSEKTDSLTHNETAKYRGRHWVECFIVKNGFCVARSGEFIVNIVGK